MYGIMRKMDSGIGSGRGMAIFGKEEESPISMVPQKKKGANTVEQIRIYG